MALSTILALALPALALPVIDDDHRRRALGSGDQNGGNSASPKIIVPVVLAAVILLMLLVTAWWRRRRRLRQVVSDIRNNASTTNASTPAATRTQSNNRTQQTTTRTPITAPGTGPDAPPRPPRRRRRRRPSQISTKSLPAYNEQAGDEEIVLVRRVERDSMSDEDDEDDDNDDDHPRNSRITGREHSRSASETPLLDDASPEMGRISLASSTRDRSEGGHDEEQSEDTHQRSRADTSNDTSISLATAADTTNDSLAPLPEVQETTTTNAPLDDVPPYTEATRPSQDGSGLGNSQSPDAGAGPSASANTPEADALGTLRPKRRSVFRQFFALNRPGSTSTALSDAVEMAPTEPRQSLSAASATSTTTAATTQGAAQARHRPSASISTLASSSRGHGHTLSPSLSSLLLTRSRSPTRSSDSLAQRYSISAPIPTTLIRTELSYPRSGPTPEQIRFLSSRESLGRFGMPYGEEAVAAAARSRENISSMISPPQYELGASTNATSETQNTTVTPNSRRARLGSSTLSQAPTIAVTAAEPEPEPESESEPLSTEPQSASRPGSPQTGTAEQNAAATHDARSTSGAAADQPERPDASVSGSAMPANDRRDSVLSTNSFVTATEGDRETVAEGRGEDDDGNDSDSAPPTPTVETYRLADEDTTVRVSENTEHQAGTVRQPARGQTILIPGSQTDDDAHHPQLTFIPATPTVDAPARAA